MNEHLSAVHDTPSLPKAVLKGKNERGRIAGVYAPTVTAFASDGSVNLEGVRKFTRFLLDHHVNGLTPLGSAGEPIALSIEERKRIIEVIAEETAGQVPIFAGGGTQSRVREQQFRWIAAKEQVTATSRQTERLARDAYLGVISEISRVEALKQGFESSQTSLKATEAGYEVGTRTSVDVLDQRRLLVNAQTAYLQSRYDYLQNVVNLRLAAGNLDPQTLEDLNKLLTETVQAAPTQPNAPPPPPR